MPTMVIVVKDLTEQQNVLNTLKAVGWKQVDAPSGDKDFIAVPDTDAAKQTAYFLTDMRLTRGVKVQRLRIKRLA